MGVDQQSAPAALVVRVAVPRVQRWRAASWMGGWARTWSRGGLGGMWPRVAVNGVLIRVTG
eukprot:6683500-Prymnesium_polylepis.1